MVSNRKCNPMTWTEYDSSCCKGDEPCGIGEGPCTNDDGCKGSLVCNRKCNEFWPAQGDRENSNCCNSPKEYHGKKLKSFYLFSTEILFNASYH